MRIATRRITLADKVAALRSPAVYPEPTRAVQAIETHMSWVFLTDARVYKLKKPGHSARQNFRTLHARRFNCEEELRLNRRLASDVYEDVVPLVKGRDGLLCIGGPGRAVEWLVRMRRLPSGSMLDVMLKRGDASPQHMLAIAQRMAAFHRAQTAAPLNGDAHRAQLMGRIAECEHELCAPEWHLPTGRVQTLCTQLRTLLRTCSEWLDRRIRDARVVEGHGDLRPEHISLGEPLAIIDCLEFSPELRLLDGIDEVGFLALECERAHAAPLAAILLQGYRAAANDTAPEALLHFYQSLRACERARLSILHLRTPRYRASAQWRRQTIRYLALAARHLRAARVTPVPEVR